MGTTAQKLEKLVQTKTEIRTAIINKGVEVPTAATFASYAEYIAAIQAGGVQPTGTIEITQQNNTDVSDYATANVRSSNVTLDDVNISVNPTIQVSASGLITANYSNQSAAELVVNTPGWLENNISNTINASGSTQKQLDVVNAQTYTPSTTDQIISSQQYITGDQTILGDANLIGNNIRSTVSIFGVQGELVVNKYYTGTEEPSADLGNDGDIYIQY